MGIYIGTSGWSYPHWDGVLYSGGSRPADRLAVYSQNFDTVELNASFYHWPADRSFASWQRRLPEEFRFSVKAPRGLTHAKKLYAPEAWIDRIRAGWQQLADRRGVLLVQLGPDFARDDARLEYFLARIPAWIRAAVEFRHPTWHNDATFSCLERHRVAYCVMSGAELPCLLRATTDIVYVRLHGPDDNHLYAGSYRRADMRWWADRILEWHSSGHDVYAYFNNDGNGNAVRNAQTLRYLVGQ